MELLFWLIVLAAGIFILVKAADYFTANAEIIGQTLGLSSFVTGVLIVAFCTTLPELATSIMAKWNNESAVVAGNIFGTVVVNILVGFGLACLLVKKIAVEKKIYQGDLSVLVGAVVLGIFTAWDGQITIIESVLYLILFFSYLVYLFFHRQLEKKVNIVQPVIKWWQPVVMTVSLVVIFLAAKYLIVAIVHISGDINMPTSVIAATALALGTSLPEIAVAISLAKKEKFELLLGDLIGANIIDILLIMGVTGIFGGLAVSTETIYIVLPFLVATIGLFWVVCRDKKIIRLEGFIMLIIYVLFVAKLFNLF